MLHRLGHSPRMLTTLRCVLVGMLVSVACVDPAHASDQCKPTPTDRKKIGLVLGGGGARGIAHVGVIRVLEEMRVPIDYVAGTSMGSIIGGLYATGMTADQLEAAIRALNWSDIFADSTIRAERPFRRKRDDDLALFGPKFGVGPKSSLLPRGAISGQKIQFFLQTVTSERVQSKDFDALPIPFRAIAADIVTGKSVVISQGDLATAMRASMSIPGLFSPIEFEGHLLVDGGIVNNLPVNVVQGLGADTVIAVDVGTPLSTRKELTDFVSITSQLSGIMVVNNTEIQKSLLTPRGRVDRARSRQHDHIRRLQQIRSIDTARLRSGECAARQIGAVRTFAGGVRRLSGATRAVRRGQTRHCSSCIWTTNRDFPTRSSTIGCTSNWASRSTRTVWKKTSSRSTRWDFSIARRTKSSKTTDSTDSS